MIRFKCSRPAALILASVASALSGPQAAAAPAAFAPCAVCHTVNPGGPNRLGPNLYGIAGGKAASKPGFAYSAALKASRITWTRDSLIAFLDNPAASVPGNRMPYAGTRDPKKSALLAEYILSLK